MYIDRNQIIAKLREHASELKGAGVQHPFLHGSYACGTATHGSSDVDIIAEFEPGRRLSLVDMVALENRLTELLGVRADLSPRQNIEETYSRQGRTRSGNRVLAKWTIEASQRLEQPRPSCIQSRFKRKRADFKREAAALSLIRSVTKFGPYGLD